MPQLQKRHLPIVTLALSLPLFFSFQLKNPPEFLNGLPFVAVWTWGVLASVTLPILVVLEGVMCCWFLWRPIGPSTSWRHGAALLAAVVAEVVFVLARRSP